MSYSSSRSSSSSIPTSLQTPQSTAALQIAQTAASLGEYTFNWAIQNYAATTAMTDQAVTNYLQMSQIGLGLANQQLNQYENQYVPEMQQLGQLAGTYSSTGREALNAGQAESASEQGTQAGLAAATQNLQSYGINPSSGMYGELEEAQRAGGGAAAAGAGNEAIQSTEAAGRQLLGESVQVGEQLPGDTVNDLNSAYQGVAGAENAVLSNAQTGANLLDASNPFLSTAMSLKYPPVGNTQGSTSMSNTEPGQKSSSGSNGSGGRGGGYSQPRSVTPSQGGGNQGSTGGGRNLTTAGLGGGPTIRTVPGGGGDYFNNPGPLTQQDVDTSNSSSYTQSGQYQDPYGATTGQSAFSQDQNIPNYDTSGLQTGTMTVGQGAGTMQQQSGIPSDPFNMPNQFGGATFDTPDTSGFNTSGQGFGGGDTSGGGADTSFDTGTSGIPYADNSGATDNTTNSQGGNYSQMPQPDQTSDQSDQGSYQGSYQQQSQYQPQQSGGGYYARGGDVHQAIPTTGGHVNRNLSPSQGRQTDDIPARLNADEFVVPRDVAQWKGQEFFHKMIEQSRKARMGMTQQTQAQPKSKAPLPNQNRPKFVSRPMGAR